MTTRSGRPGRVRRPSRAGIIEAKKRAAELTEDFQARRAVTGGIAQPLPEPPAEAPEPRLPRSPLKPVTEAMLARLERAYGARIRQAEREAARDRLNAKWRPWEGTPETNERIERVPSRRRQWPMDRMLRLGKIGHEEHLAAQEIAWVVEMIECAVSVRCASLEARVDNSGSARDVLVESMGRVRLEIAFRTWRSLLPKPPRMILDMVLTNQSYVAISRRHGMHWRTARKRLISALRRWPEIRSAVNASVRREDLAEIYARLGEGTLLPPRLRTTQATDEADA